MTKILLLLDLTVFSLNLFVVPSFAAEGRRSGRGRY
jgi:hypothetical protein